MYSGEHQIKIWSDVRAIANLRPIPTYQPNSRLSSESPFFPNKNNLFWDNSISGLAHCSNLRNLESPTVGPVLRSDGHLALTSALKQARLDAGLTQAELASRVGRTQSFVAKIEAGERRIDVVEMIVLARILRADPTEMVKTIKRVVPANQEL